MKTKSIINSPINVGVEFISTLNHLNYRAESRVHIMTFIVMALPLQYNPCFMLSTPALADSKAAQFNHPITFFTTPYKSMKINIIQNLNCTIYAAHLHNLCTFPVQFVQILALFCKKFQDKIMYFNMLTTQKLFFTCTNYATINPISIDYQSHSTCTISSVTRTIYATKSHNHHIINKLINVQITHLH
jgi:hypothetical protein